MEDISRKQDEDRELFLQRLEVLKKAGVTLAQRVDKLIDTAIMQSVTTTALLKLINELLDLLKEERRSTQG